MGRLEKLVGNASILILFQLLVSGVFAQDTTYVQQFDMYVDKLSKSEMQTSMLYNRVFSFAKLNPQQFSKEERDSIKNDFKNWKQVYLEMYNADYANATKENFETFLEKTNEFRIQSKKIPIGVINYRFEFIDSMALYDGRITMQEDKPIRSMLNSKSPFLLDSVCLLSLLSNQLYTGYTKLILDPKFYYTNTSTMIRKVILDFSDDKGKHILSIGDSLILNFTTIGDVSFSYRIEFSNGKVVESNGVLSVVSNGTEPCFTNGKRSDLFTLNYDSVESVCTYEYGIYFSDCENSTPESLKNPILILDGFDPADSRKIGNIYDLINAGQYRIAEKLREKGHDLIICNFREGGNLIEINALAIREIIEFIKLRTTDKIIVIGPSMGGLVARFALAKIEQENKDHQTSLYISFDAPHQGANIPIGIQYFLYFFGEVVGDANAKEGLNQINSDAARQMLMHHQYENSIPPKYNYHRKQYLDNVAINGKLNSKGYPVNLRKVSVINGSSISIPQGVNGKLFSMTKKIMGATVGEAQIYSSPNRGTSQVAYCSAVNRDDVFHVRRLRKYASVVPGSPYPTNIDNVPGGYFNTQQIITGLVKGQSGNGFYLENDIHSFIPSTSALDLQFPTQFVNYNLNIKNANIYCNNQTPFDAYYAPDNNEDHVFISLQNSNWILKEIENATRSVGVTSNTMEISSGQVFNYGSNTKKYCEKSFTVTNGGIVGVNMNSPTGYNNEAIPAMGSIFKLEGYNNVCGSINIEVNSNGTLVLGDANSNKGEWYISDNSVLRIKDFGKLIINDNSKLVINRGSKLIIGKNSIIQLLGNNAQLIIEGDLEIEEDAILTFTGNGFINLKSNAITWGRNSKLILEGSNINAKVLEIDDAKYLLQGFQNQSSSSIEIKNGLVSLMGTSSFINAANKVHLENVIISGGKGLVLNGQKEVSIVNCTFLNNKVGLTYYSNLLEKFNVLGNPLILTNASFSGCDIAIKILGKGFRINGVNFTNCKQGIVADGMDMHSELVNSNLSNTNNQNSNPYTYAGLSFVGISGSTLTIQNSTIHKFNTGIYNSQSTLNLKCSNITSSKFQNLWVANNASLNMGPSGNSYCGNNELTVLEGLNNKNILLEQVNFLNLINGANKFKLSDVRNNYFVAGTAMNIPNTMHMQRNNWYADLNSNTLLNPPNQNNFIVKLNAGPSSPRVNNFNVIPVLGVSTVVSCMDINKPIDDPCETPGSCNDYLNDPLSVSKNSSFITIPGYTAAAYNVLLKQILTEYKDDVKETKISNTFNALCNLYLVNDSYDSIDVIYLKDLTYLTITDVFDKIYYYEYYQTNSKPEFNYVQALNKLAEVQQKRYAILKATENNEREFSLLMDMAQLKGKLGQYNESILLLNEALLKANTSSSTRLANHWICITKLKEQMLVREFTPDEIDSALLECEELITPQSTAGRGVAFKVDTSSSSMNKYSNIYINPNPSNGEFTVSVDGENTEINRVDVYNLQGSLVFRKAFQDKSNTQLINTQTIDPGMYLIKIYTNTGVTTKKLLFNK